MWTNLVGRCHLALGNMEEVREMAARSSPATGYMAVFIRSQQDGQKRAAYEKILEAATTDPVSQYYATIVRALQGDYIDAINYAKAMASSSPSEFNALVTQFSLAIHRPDLAEDVLGKSAANRDDSAANKLASALYTLVENKHSDAYLCYSDLIAQFNAESSVILSNGRAVANIQRGLYNESQEDLEIALAAHPDDPDTLANLTCALVHQGKFIESRKLLEQLTAVRPDHPLVKRAESVRALFA
jgi:tetratricopeptide (TPR) repeat protein